MTKPILHVNGLSKFFPGVKALEEVNFDLNAGEVHILVGENGAGKSTLSKCILGAYQPDAGEIFLEGKEVRFSSPKEALSHGIAAVYQELTMIPYLNAAHNIFFNREPKRRGTPLIDHRTMQRRAKELLAALGCDIDTTVPVKHLGVAEQQMVEIAKALSFDPKIIVFDEPTATLSDREVDSFFEHIRLLKERNIGIIYVSHRMKEFARIGDRITVLRDGKYIKTIRVGEYGDEELVNLMVGRDISQVYVRTPNEHTGEVLRAVDIADKKGKVKNCSFTLNSGEIVGMAGLVGAGRTEMARLLFGIDKPAHGRVYLYGRDVTGKRPAHLVASGLGLLPEDRKQLGLAVRAPIFWNVVAVGLKKYFPRVILSKKKNVRIAAEYVEQLKIATPDVKRSARALSGGNQQKVVLAKWLCAHTNVIIFDEPTRGIDVGAKMEIYALMDALACQGKAILMISSEMQEIIGMSDRIYTMNNGAITGEISRGDFSADAIGKMMLLETEGAGE